MKITAIAFGLVVAWPTLAASAPLDELWNGRNGAMGMGDQVEQAQKKAEAAQAAAAQEAARSADTLSLILLPVSNSHPLQNDLIRNALRDNIVAFGPDAVIGCWGTWRPWDSFTQCLQIRAWKKVH